MKAVPVLVVTNALALGLAVLLFFQQEELKSQVSASRGAGSRNVDSAVDRAVLDERLAILEARLASGRGSTLERETPAPAPAPAEGGSSASPSSAAPGSSPAPTFASPALPGDSAVDASSYDPAEMESFRRKVRVALDLNREEEEVKGVVDALDGLATRSQIGSLSDVQKEKAAKSIVSARRKIPEVWRKVMADPANQNLPWDQRRQVIQSEMGNLRAAAQKELEEFIPAADAKKIAEETLRGDRGVQALQAAQPGRGGVVVPGGPN
jgi:hypothetical protein